MSERKSMTGEEIMAAAVGNLDATIKAAEEGMAGSDVVDTVYDKTMRTIAEVAFGECSYPNYCKFYGENPSFCDRICSESVWDQI